jgi:hypothetical protein
MPLVAPTQGRRVTAKTATAKAVHRALPKPVDPFDDGVISRVLSATASEPHDRTPALPASWTTAFGLFTAADDATLQCLNATASSALFRTLLMRLLIQHTVSDPDGRGVAENAGPITDTLRAAAADPAAALVEHVFGLHDAMAELHEAQISAGYPLQPADVAPMAWRPPSSPAERLAQWREHERTLDRLQQSGSGGAVGELLAAAKCAAETWSVAELGAFTHNLARQLAYNDAACAGMPLTTSLALWRGFIAEWAADADVHMPCWLASLDAVTALAEQHRPAMEDAAASAARAAALAQQALAATVASRTCHAAAAAAASSLCMPKRAPVPRARKAPKPAAAAPKAHTTKRAARTVSPAAPLLAVAAALSPSPAPSPALSPVPALAPAAPLVTAVSRADPLAMELGTALDCADMDWLADLEADMPWKALLDEEQPDGWAVGLGGL